MMKMTILAALLAGLIPCATVNARAALADVVSIEGAGKRAALRQSMRKLWADHVIWTRGFIVAELAGSTEADDIAMRLLKNQADIGESFAPFYGKEAGERLTGLFRQHIVIAGEVVDAAKIGDERRLKDADQRWHDNAGEIAVFLSGVNPLLPKKALIEMLDDHLALTTKEALAQIDKNWADDIGSFDLLFGHMMTMADELADGVIKQFPEKF